MAVDRSAVLEENLRAFIGGMAPATGVADWEAPLRPDRRLSGRVAYELLESQFSARALDLAARELKREDLGYYTIGSAGHEGNVVLGRVLRPTDPTFLHYRSGALMVERARHVPGSTPLFDVLLSLVASSDDPISGGRHKVFGSRRLWVPPQTSTIASHLPKAVGCAFSLERAHRVGVPLELPDDAIACCTFGDASVNHASAQTAFNAASWASFQSLPMPLLFVCEDNQIGISVRTPTEWVKTRLSRHPSVAYFRGDGLDLVSAYEAAAAAAEYVRERRRPAFLHLEVVRLLGHAGSDVETEYRSREEIEALERLDPLLRSAELILQAGLAEPDDLLALWDELKARISAGAQEAKGRPRLTSAQQVMASLAPHDAAAVAGEAQRPPDHPARVRMFGADGALPEASDRPRHLAFQINRALADGLAKYPEMLIFGEDVGKKGGVYHVTTGLAERAGKGRVFNTLLDETTILGLAIGAGHLGLLPVPEIQYLAYYHNAEDQIRGEACSLQFFSGAQFQNPMVMRIASFGYQRGFGGHFHNDGSIAALRDVPGLILAAPARPDDAVRVLRTCLAKAKVDGSVVAFLEPIALYMTKDLHEKGDEGWLTPYPPVTEAAPFGRARVHGADDARDLLIISYANGFYLSLKAARTLEREFGIRSRVLDLLWLAPLDRETILSEASRAGSVVVVDEGRRSGGVNEAILALLLEGLSGSVPPVTRVCSEDCYVPLGPAAHELMPSEAGIVAAARKLAAIAAEGLR